MSIVSSAVLRVPLSIFDIIECVVSRSGVCITAALACLAFCITSVFSVIFGIISLLTLLPWPCRCKVGALTMDEHETHPPNRPPETTLPTQSTSMKGRKHHSGSVWTAEILSGKRLEGRAVVFGLGRGDS